MALRPGRRLEMSSHFMPPPLSSMMTASSSADHLLCFFAGDSDGCVPILRLPPLPMNVGTWGGRLVAAEGVTGTEEDRV